MKKLITSTIIVLPLIILAILLVSGAVMSLTTHIYVEALDLIKEDVIRLRMEDENTPPTYDLAADVTILPLKATNRAVTFKSEDESIATIDANGKITAKFFGETYVSVTSNENKAATRKRKVVVWDDKAHLVKIDDQEPNQKIDLYSNTKTVQLTASVYPVEAKNKGIKWESSAPEILEVTQNGTLNVCGVGEVTVSAVSLENDQIFDTVTVVCHAKLTDIVFDKSAVSTAEEHLTFPQNIELRPATTNPADITYSYKSSNDEIATVNEAGEISFKQPGQVEITVTATDFGGTQKSYSKTYESTCGYFATPIFKMTELSWNDCHTGGDLTQYQFDQLPNTTKGVGEITCIKDGADSVEDVIVFNQQHKFVFGENLECVEKFDVTIHANAYDFNQHALVATEQTLHINKTASESGRSAVVTCNGKELEKNQLNELTIADIGESLTLEITGTEVAPIINDNFYVTASHDNNTITLTAKHAKPDGQSMTLTLGVSVYDLLVKVEAKAHEISVEFDGTKIENGNTYNTLFDSLTLTVNPTRTDSEDITNKTISYQYGNLGWQNSEPGEIEIKNLSSGENQIEFSCGDVKFKFAVKLITLEDFGVKISNTISGGVGSAELGNFESATSLEGEQLVRLSSNSLDNVTLEIVPKVELLGGFGSNENFKELFTFKFTPTSWQQNYDTTNKQITLGFAGEQDFNNLVELTYAAITLQFRFLRTNLNSIEFAGFDSKTDNYAGYQQVRVFAKHSFYGTTESEQAVDYFKIPLAALRNDEQPASLDALTWTLTRYVGDKAESVLTTQLGKEITYNGAKYTQEKVEGGYVLKDAKGTIVVNTDGKNPNGITFVDCFSESGYARIYFGNFEGLRETDVQNDYFGNFGEQTNWKEPNQTVDDGSGRAREKSTKNSFAFLRVEAGDGAEHGTNRHFNFNVLDDGNLTNIFNATGYYKFSKIVLHNTLYGPDELKGDGNKEQQAKDNDLILSRTTTGNSNDTNLLGKDTIYGNGYSLNFEAKNAELKKDNNKNNSWGVNIGKAYNTKIKCANPEETISYVRQKVVFNANYLYYCDVEYYEKMRPISTGGTTFIKNCSLRNVSEGAYMLYYDQEKAYFENVVIVNCLAGIEFANGSFNNTYDPNKHMDLYLKGNFDVLNYVNKQSILKLAGDYANNLPSYMIDSLMNGLEPYLEWFGNTTDGLNIETQRYANLIMYVDCTKLGWTVSKKINYWDNGTYLSTNSQGYARRVTTGDVEISRIPLKLSNLIDGWSYDVDNSIDGGIAEDGKYKSRDMSQLFTDERYIRLLCQFKCEKDGKLVENTDHIQWHINQVFRDTSLIDGLADHITDLVHSLEDKDGQHIEWNDKSTAQEAIDLWQQAQAANKALTTFILPEKKEY